MKEICNKARALTLGGGGGVSACKGSGLLSPQDILYVDFNILKKWFLKRSSPPPLSLPSWLHPWVWHHFLNTEGSVEEKPSVNSDETSCQEVSSTTTDTKEMPAITDTAEINGQDELQVTEETKDSVENNEENKEENKDGNKDEKKDEKVSLKESKFNWSVIFPSTFHCA